MVFVAFALGAQLNLIDDPKVWSSNTDRPGATVTIDVTNGMFGASVVSNGGGAETFPKLVRQEYETPQDWRGYTRLNTRLRVTSDDPTVKMKPIAFVFYDEQTRRTDLPTNEMTQQIIAHSIPVGEWIDVKTWLGDIRRAAIRRVVVYLYELPPPTAHSFRWEFERLELEKVSGDADVLAGSIKPDAGAFDEAARLATNDGLELNLSAKGAIASIDCEGRGLGSGGVSPTGLLVRDVGSDGPVVSVGGEIKQEQETVRQSARLEDLGLAVSATYRAAGPFVEVQGTVSDTRGQDRALTVYFAVPVAEAPWTWWDSVAASRTTAGDGEALGYFEGGVEYGVRGEHSKYPLGAITWPDHDGLTLAIRMDEPVVHRIAYIPKLKLFYIAFDFGLVAETRVDGRPLSEAPFRFLLYRHDPAWGFRSALQRYYEFFPEFFTKRAKSEGGWYVWGNVKDTPDAKQAGFGFHWGPSGADAVKYDNENGYVSLSYIEPELTQQTMGDFKEAPTVDESLARFLKLVDGDGDEMAKVEKLAYAGSYTPGNWLNEHSLRESLQTVSRAALASVNYGENGKPSVGIIQAPWISDSQWAAIFPCNLDPDIPGGKGWFASRVFIDYALRGMDEQGARFDGIALDSFGGYNQYLRANYRREHFKYSNAPLSFSSTSSGPVQVAAFASVEFVRQLASEMQAQGKVLMANCAWNVTPGWLTFAAPYLDIFGAEAPQFSDPDFIRAIAYRKPCTDLPYTPRPAWEVPWHWLHGIHPGMGNDIEAMKQVTGLLHEMTSAGWEPITGARVKPEHVRVERFGSLETVYLALHNASDSEAQAELEVDTSIISLAGATVTLMPLGQAVEPESNVLTAKLSPRETVVFVIHRK
jgi:hypothetical protein